MSGKGILVFGATGQVARELARLAPEARFLARDEAGLTQPEACASAILEVRPRAVINAAAWTAVDRAETEEAPACLVNAASPGAMARACADLRIPFLHVSTDYVFDGSGTRARTPLDQTAPLNVYGRSKLEGENLVTAAGGSHLILRTSWVFSAHGANFLKSMLRLGASRDSLNVVADQIGGPTPADAIAAALLRATDALLDGTPGGIHHFAGTPMPPGPVLPGRSSRRRDLPAPSMTSPPPTGPHRHAGR